MVICVRRCSSGSLLLSTTTILGKLVMIVLVVDLWKGGQSVVESTLIGKRCMCKKRKRMNHEISPLIHVKPRESSIYYRLSRNHWEQTGTTFFFETEALMRYWACCCFSIILTVHRLSSSDRRVFKALRPLGSRHFLPPGVKAADFFIAGKSPPHCQTKKHGWKRNGKRQCLWPRWY